MSWKLQLSGRQTVVPPYLLCRCQLDSTPFKSLLFFIFFFSSSSILTTSCLRESNLVPLRKTTLASTFYANLESKREINNSLSLSLSPPFLRVCHCNNYLTHTIYNIFKEIVSSSYVEYFDLVYIWVSYLKMFYLNK